MTTPTLTRLNKRMAELGLCSRREADDWIDKGWVYVNKTPAHMGMKVLEGDVIEVKNLATQEQSERVTILLNKPVGYVSAQAEDGHTPAMALIQAQNHWTQDRSTWRFHHGQLRGLAPAGRLDIDSVGFWCSPKTAEWRANSSVKTPTWKKSIWCGCSMWVRVRARTRPKGAI